MVAPAITGFPSEIGDRPMSAPPANEPAAGPPAFRVEPYARLVRSLLPRASSIAMFGPTGELMWSSETTTGPDLMNVVDDALSGARTNPGSGGQLRLLAGNQPVYLCPMRDDAGQLLGVVAVVCRPSDSQDKKPQDFSFAHSLLAPALECLRRELVTHVTIADLNAVVSELNRDLGLLLTHGASEQSSAAADGAGDLQLLLQQTVEHLRALTGALLVPEKNLTLLRAAGSGSADARFLMRAHRKLLALAQGRREPLIINEIAVAVPDTYPYRVLCCALRSRAGRCLGVLTLLRDETGEHFTERDAHIAQILARKSLDIIESSYDALSGLYTRPAFERRVSAVVADPKTRQRWSALYIDVDQLHAINEKSGMHVGDSVLSQIGELVRSRLPPGAFGARISGDRFAVLLPAQVQDAERFAQALRTGVEQLSAVQGDTRAPISISVGVALLDGNAAELAHVLAAAETACKAAKDRGRNRVEVYQSSDASIVRRYADISVAGQLREAIDAGRLRLDAQLILPFAAADNARPHYELLLRMIGDDGQIMGPDSFLSAATRYQLMPVIDRWVVNHVIEALQPRAHALAGKALGFTINFSGQSLNDETFADFLIERIGSSGLDPDLLCFELTENATVQNLTRAEALMRRLRKLGCGVALDDFGTGLSSLSCLRQLPVTMLKIDGSFVRDVLKDVRAESMVRAVAQLARGMSIITVAEYIETEEIGDRVSQLGVDYGQGFAIGKPLPLADLLAEIPVAGAPASDRAAAVVLPDSRVPDSQAPDSQLPDSEVPLVSEPAVKAESDGPALTAAAFEESDPNAVTCESVVLETPDGESSDTAPGDAGASDGVSVDAAAADGAAGGHVRGGNGALSDYGLSVNGLADDGLAEADTGLADADTELADAALSDGGLCDSETTEAEAEILDALDKIAASDAAAAGEDAAALAAVARLPASGRAANNDDATDVQPELVVWYPGAVP
jgi:diguanylate cyclase (GGDEF)-like protein